ncbi:MAG: purine/pyrimidine permease [Candidatus Adiutrix sp.]|jgi:uracil-xanthine permease|nr:purine/pyrimidine permease [Candidatus Adiutrix sp.]
MSDTAATSEKNLGIVYGLEDKPPFIPATLTAIQHLMSMVVSIGSPPLIICRALNMPLDITIYMVNIAFFVSGIGTFIQTTRIGPFGSGLLSIQATSFIFPTAFIALGKAALDGGASHEEVIALMSGAVVAGSFIQMALSRMTGLLNRVFTPLVCGITVAMVGISLLNVAMTNVVGGFASFGTENFASVKNLSLGGLVLLCILVFNCFKNPVIRMSAMIIGFVVGAAVAAWWGMLNPVPENVRIFSVPMPFRYGISFGLGGFVSIALLYVISTVEATGDLSATSMLSKEPTSGPVFIRRLGGGILCDGFASLLAGCFNSFPMAIFAQNNGVIQLTGNASRHVGKYIAVFLLILGVFPVVGVVFNIIPDPVLGGALILLFGIITATGMRIIFTDPITRRSILIIGISVGVGVGAAFQPNFTLHLPLWLADLLHSPVAAGGLTAIVTNLLLPKSMDEENS